MADDEKSSVLKNIVYQAAAVFVAVFAIIWLWVCWKVISYSPTRAMPRLEIGSSLGLVAGFLATTVATGTATVLGIEIAKIQETTVLKSSDGSTLMSAAGTPRRLDLRAALMRGLTRNNLIAAGCYAYLIVGVIVLLVFILNEDKAPGMMSTFALSAVGWIAGAFSATFKST